MRLPPRAGRRTPGWPGRFFPWPGGWPPPGAGPGGRRRPAQGCPEDHRPHPWSSKDLATGSVVVPATGETREVACPVRALMREDFPALRRPTGRCAGGWPEGCLGCPCHTPPDPRSGRPGGPRPGSAPRPGDVPLVNGVGRRRPGRPAAGRRRGGLPRRRWRLRFPVSSAGRFWGSPPAAGRMILISGIIRRRMAISLLFSRKLPGPPSWPEACWPRGDRGCWGPN